MNLTTTNQENIARLKSLRVSLGMTTREFGKLFGKTHSTISHWENSVVEIPEIALKLLTIFEKEHADKLKKKDRTQSRSL